MLIGKYLVTGALLATVVLVGGCGGNVSGPEGGPRDLADPNDPGAPGTNQPGNPGSPGEVLSVLGPLPSPASTGITDEWCPRWDELKTTSGSVTLTGDAPVLEYRQISGQLVIKTDDATVRCVKITTESDPFLCDNEGGCADGTLVEDTHSEETVGGSAGFNVWTGVFSGRRLKSHPTGCDGITFEGGLLWDSYINTRDDPKCTSSAPHADTIQTSMSKGPIWVLNTTFIGATNSSSCAFFTTDFGPILDVTVAGSYFTGGAATVRFSNKSNHGPPNQVRFLGNTLEDESWFYDPYVWTSDGAAGSGQCVEYEGNVLENGDEVPGDRPPNAELEGGCVDVSPVPTWRIGDLATSSEACSQGQGACDGIGLSASASGSQAAGSPRWRFNCGGSASNAGGSHPQGADLWYDYSACSGQASCTMTNVCDYSAEAAGTYTARVYSESGPGSGIRVSDSASVIFTVSN